MNPGYAAIDDLHHGDEVTVLVTRCLAIACDRISGGPTGDASTTGSGHRPEGEGRLMAEIDRACDVVMFRTSVRKAIIRAIEEIERSHPAAAHLRQQISTRSSCRDATTKV
jgi:hypothetical protein